MAPGLNLIMNRVIFFIDGFNLYHALDNCKKYHPYKWLNLSRLSQCYVTKNDIIEDIYYFTALAKWSPKKMSRHQVLLKALKIKGLKIVYGAFKKVDKRCRLCNREYQTFEEKMTDVNITIYLLKLAVEDRYDTAMLISGDTDLIPAIKAVQETFPTKRVGVVLPIGRRSEDLKQTCDFHMKMKEKHLKSSVFEKEIDIGDGQMLVCPESWS